MNIDFRYGPSYLHGLGGQITKYNLHRISGQGGAGGEATNEVTGEES